MANVLIRWVHTCTSPKDPDESTSCRGRCDATLEGALHIAGSSRVGSDLVWLGEFCAVMKGKEQHGGIFMVGRRTECSRWLQGGLEQNAVN